MKFSTVLLFLSACSLTLAQANFRAQNAADAEKLQKQFDALTPNSPCQNGQQACVKGEFAQCVNGKFSLTPCSGGNQCVVLPLVNKAGTSVTCDSKADQQARLAEARGQKTKRDLVSRADQDGKGKNGKDVDQAKKGKAKVEKAKGKGKAKEAKGKGKAKEAKGKGKAKEAKGKGKAKEAKGKGKAKEAKAKGKAKEAKGKGKAKEAKGKGKAKVGKGKEGVKQNGGGIKKRAGDIAAIRKANAKQAQDEQKKFASLKPDSPCKGAEVSCVGKKVAQCSGGKFVLNDCAGGLECASLPLVLKAGTSVTCTSESDRLARIDQAMKNQ